MALRRRSKVYCSYLRDNIQSCSIPRSTWRRWLIQGKITEERLLQLGINPGRKRRPKKSCLNRRSVSGEGSPAHSVKEGGENTSENSCSDLEVEPDGFFSGFNDRDVCADSTQVSSILQSKSIGVEILNQPLTAGINVTKFEVLLMIFHLAMRHSMTDIFVVDLISFVNELVGIPEAIPSSKYLFQKLFMFGSDPNVHFFCPSCNIYLGCKASFENDVKCDHCNWSQSVSNLNAGNYFVTLSIREQLQMLLDKQHIKMVSREQRHDQVICDVFDGQIYKNLLAANCVLHDPNSLSITISTDGSPVYQNGPNSLWPIHFYLNEIVPDERFDVENIMLAGLWFSKKGEPDLQMFLKPLVDEMKALGENGIIWRKPDGTIVESRVFLICCCADSVARPKIQNMLQFNGSYGCSYCLHPNISFTITEPMPCNSRIVISSDAVQGDNEDADPCRQLTRRRQLKRYLAGKEYSLRTDEEVRQLMKMATESDLEHLYGYKGMSVLLPLESMDMVFGIPIDYMHSVLLGVMRRLACLWFDSTSSGQPYYIGLKISTVNKRLQGITPPSIMPKPRAMSDRSHWKAKEWRGFLLYYGLPCLKDVLPDPYFAHFSKLVASIYTLCKGSISHEEAGKAEFILKRFVDDYQTLYGPENMVYNVHLLGHLPTQALKVGPLWAYSLFPFESANGRLVRIVKGTRSVGGQIARKYLMTLNISKLLKNYGARDTVVDFCSKVVEYSYNKTFEKCGDILLFGKPNYIVLKKVHQEALQVHGITIANVAKVYNRVAMHGILYSSRNLSRQKVSNDSCIRLVTGEFLMVDLIISVCSLPVEPVMWCLGTVLNIAINSDNNVPPHLKQCAIDPYGQVKAFPFSHIKKKCFLMAVDSKIYISECSNKFEKS
ncbi:uncharacterized protein LOC124172516 [Ischnura elegans]|uniref:uncharacterized protein LOC124172516 n=1 Tax=Ischnura elegans TaxID=197161 RepID=UPI001ED893BB|nr:uncharacterized protein LOC124172516 [Ischnura elegans]